MPLKMFTATRIDTERLKEIEADVLARLAVGIEKLEGETDPEFRDRKVVWARCMMNFLNLTRYAISTRAFESEIIQ